MARLRSLALYCERVGTIEESGMHKCVGGGLRSLACSSVREDRVEESGML